MFVGNIGFGLAFWKIIKKSWNTIKNLRTKKFQFFRGIILFLKSISY
jgi:hypothetical protein